MKLRTPRVLGAVLIAGLTIGIAAPAFAATTTRERSSDVSSTDIENAKARCVQAIDHRLDTMAKMQSQLDAADFVTEAHTNSLQSIINSTNSGLRNLRDGINSSEDPNEVRAMCKSIGPDYRVYLVVVPQARLTVGADRITHSQARFDDLTAKFDATADRAVEQFDVAISLVDGVSDSVLAVTPAGFDEGPGQVTLEVARESIGTSVGQLRSARATGQKAVQALKDAIAAITNS